MTDQKPSTPPAGPSGVSRPQDNHDVQQALRRVNDVIGGALRQIAAITGQPDPAPPAAPAPNHLDAMRTAWDEGHEDAGCQSDDCINPYEKLLTDRREFIREAVNESLGYMIDEDGVDVLGDDNAEWFDAVLDAHDEWLALQRHTDVALVNAQIRAEQAEARVAELNSVLQQLLITVSPGRAADVRHEDMVDDVRTVLERAGYGTQPDGWVPPYSADTALGKIWRVLTASTLDRDDQRLNGVRDILADMGYHEHVHTRLATPDDAPVELCGNRPHALTGIGFVGQYACNLPAGHDGQHSDGQYGVAWDAEAVTDDDPLPGCTSTHALGIAVYTCTRPAGHDAFHQDKRYGVAWAADGSSSWRVK
ncbi:hypothetical protein SEA_JABBERWOCKY_59 [Gordonia phage Jabberwocky]|uniref:Uncharacterized protein n=1 Tax=Gordonia phage Jabberwocky TaxID=2653273 RepID=A0A5P8D522_9CAUD|nr:hypothetical protein KNU76_gp59 [Gordonia phage Jabberwocky]QFP94114.1 hypothetical protein SEA_JABBERWOCKY_59 [Gordonia phage Jabberwocky]